MPARIDFDADRNLLNVELHGRIDLKYAVTIIEAMTGRPDLQGPNGLIDTSNLTGLDLVGPDIRTVAEIAKRADAMWAGGRWAVVAPRDLVYGMARMYQMVRSGAPYQIEVFRNRDEALAWVQG